MYKQVIIIDDFYQDPDDVRAKALALDFDVEGNYPGKRSWRVEDEHADYLKTFFEESVVGKPITFWDGEYNTAFQYTTEEDSSWIHHDNTEWAAVLYLTPDADPDAGTALYKHKESGVSEWDGVDDSPSDFNNTEILGAAHRGLWEESVNIANKYNRLVCYRGHQYHSSVKAGFGASKEDGRLFQTFFFNT